jgi:hypothetical protein
VTLVQYLVRFFLIGAFIFAPVGGIVADAGTKLDAPSTCENTWQDIWSENSEREKSASDVFCDHFMSAKGIFDKDSPPSVMHVFSPFLILSFTLDFPVRPSTVAAISSQYLPYSLHPEVAPHPPKKALR